MNNLWKPALVAGIVAILVAAPLVTGTGSSGSGSTSHAANKTAATGSTVEFLSAGYTGGSGSTDATILTSSIKTSSTQDLVFSVSLECALWTTVATVGNQASESTARVEVWIEFDGKAIPVVPGGDDDGTVVFCDRTHRQTVSDLDDEDARIEQYLATRSANAFNWVLEDAGSATHTVTVNARLSGAATDLAFAQAGIGARTLVVEPVRFTNDHS